VEAIEAGTVAMEDTVTVSAYAASMGGSQIFLEEGEQMTVRDMLKSIVVSSANDAAVAMAEHLAGSESAFVQRMNSRAAELGMENTVFYNCTGLLDQPEHLTTARDVAIMSRELIRHDMIKEFTTIWMDTVRDGQFGLSSTNKLIYYYDGATGLKTGFTSSAGYCLSATAERDGVEYIAVVMHCDTSQNRFESAKVLLSYGFANYTLVSTTPDSALAPISVSMGEVDSVQPEVQGDGWLLIEKSRAGSVKKTVEISGALSAPVARGQTVGSVTVSDDTGELAVLPIVAGSAVERLNWWQVFCKLMKLTFTGDL
jgi:D-alanyl-D-alanine carboxypeptidase (penicillin-binding protein 5/6)